MFSALLSIALALEKLVPFLSKLLDLGVSLREEAKRSAIDKALADAQSAKDARNAAAIAAASGQPSAVSTQPPKP
jgi:hypothetical protein